MAARGSAEVREDQSGAVELRARQVPTEYRRNAREKDQQYGPAGSTLIQDRVASFGACRAVVFGNYGEASRDVHTLIHVAAQRLATKHWRLLGACSQGGAQDNRVSTSPCPESRAGGVRGGGPNRSWPFRVC